MKNLIVAVCVACIVTLGAMSADAATANRDAHLRPAVWMRIMLPTGSTRMAITYDNTLVTVIQRTSDAPSKLQGWGFRPAIQKDGSVKVAVYRLRFTKKGASLKSGMRPQYLETLAPHPVATTTLPSDRQIQVRIMGTGSGKKLLTELRQLQNVSGWLP